MKPLLATLLALGLASSASAQVSLTTLGSPYTQDFNTLPNAGTVAWVNEGEAGETLDGWYHRRTGSGVNLVANNGGSNAGNLYSYGTGTDSDRALGSVGSGNAAVGNIFYGVRFVNNTGAAITQLQISYVGEQWRNGGNTTPHVAAFSYLVGAPTVSGTLVEFQTAGTAVSELNFTSPVNLAAAAALDGNAAANRVAISHTITGLSIAVGTEVMLRWSDPDQAGSDHGLSVDDLSVTPLGDAVVGFDVSLTLADGPDPVAAGTNLTYTAVASNAGPADAQDVAVTVPLPAGTSVVSAVADGGGSCNAVSPVVCSWAGATAAGVPRTATVVALVGAAVADGTQLNTIATVTATGVDSNPGNNSVSTTTDVVTRANLSITLTDSPDPVIAGANLTYTAALTNGGSSVAQDANITLPLPAGTSFVSAVAGGGGSCSAASPVVCTWAGATAPAAQRTATIVVRVAASVANGSKLTATATAASATTDPTPGNNDANATTTVNASADLSITLTDSPDPVVAGTSLTYTATLTNGGLSDAQGVSITLPLPAGTGFVSAMPTGGGACSAATPVVCTWSGATAAGVSHSVTVVADVAESAVDGSTLEATASAASTTPDPNANNSNVTVATTVATSADLTLTFTAGPTPVTPGLAITLNGSAINNGPSDAQNVQIAIVLGPGVQFSSATPSAGGVCTLPAFGGTGTVSCTWAGATAVGGTRGVAVTAYTYNRGSAVASASATSSTSDLTPDNNAASANITVGSGGNNSTPVMIPTAEHSVLALLALLLGLVGFVAVRQRY